MINRHEIDIVFNIDIFLQSLAIIYPETKLKTMLELKKDILYSLSIMDYDFIKDNILPHFSQIPIDFNYIKKVHIVKMFMLKKEEIFNNSGVKDLEFLEHLFYNKSYSEYLELKNIIEDINKDVNSINDYISRIYISFEKEIRNFYKNEKLRISRNLKIKKLINNDN